jgi:hypothetical protein
MPAPTPPSSATKAITVTELVVLWPLVVIVEFAQRSTASLDAVTSTAQPCRRPAAARVRSTISCGGTERAGITGLPPGC